jgi:hypothetical protein
MGQAADLQVGPPDPARQSDTPLKVRLGFVEPRRPELQAGDCYLLRPDEPSPDAEDRPRRNVLTLRAASADASVS